LAVTKKVAIVEECVVNGRGNEQNRGWRRCWI